MPYPINNMMQGYGPRPAYGKDYDEYRMQEIEQGYTDARTRYMDAMKTGNQDIAKKAMREIEFFKEQFDYMQVPTEHKKESFEPSKSDRPKHRTMKASDYMSTPLTHEQRVSYGPGSSQIGDVFGASLQREQQLKDVDTMLKAGGRKKLQEWLKQQRIFGGGFV